MNRTLARPAARPPRAGACSGRVPRRPRRTPDDPGRDRLDGDQRRWRRSGMPSRRSTSRPTAGQRHDRLQPVQRRVHAGRQLDRGRPARDDDEAVRGLGRRRRRPSSASGDAGSTSWAIDESGNLLLAGRRLSWPSRSDEDRPRPGARTRRPARRGGWPAALDPGDRPGALAGPRGRRDAGVAARPAARARHRPVSRRR